METRFTELGWQILFNEEYESIPDPNLPENTAYINAKKEESRQDLLRFVNGSGKPLYDRWRDKVKKNTLALIASPIKDCNCMSCLQIRQIQYLFQLLLEAEEVLSEDK